MYTYSITVRSRSVETGHTSQASSTSGVRVPPVTENKYEQFEAETGQEVPRAGQEVPRAEEQAARQREENATTDVLSQTPVIDVHQQSDDEAAKRLCSEETTGQPSLSASAAPATGDTNLQGPSQKGKPHSLTFGLHSASQEDLGNPRMEDLSEIEGALFRSQQSFGDDVRGRQGLKYKLQRQPISSSLHSLPSSFSPAATPKSPHAYLGYNPLRIPEMTMSQPELVPKIKIHNVKRMQARNEMMKLREATVKVINEREREGERERVMVIVNNKLWTEHEEIMI